MSAEKRLSLIDNARTRSEVDAIEMVFEANRTALYRDANRSFLRWEAQILAKCCFQCTSD
jgi:hypothetical protein